MSKNKQQKGEVEKTKQEEAKQKKFVDFCNKILNNFEEDLKIKEHRKNLTYVG